MRVLTAITLFNRSFSHIIRVVALTGCGAEKTSDKGNQAYRTLDEIKESGEINIGVF